jgi:hypothetical protein
MSTIEQEIPSLVAGDFLSREEFLYRWEGMRKIKRAELIGGVVYMPSPVSLDHGGMENRVGTWLGVYAASTPGCEACNNATWLMLENEAPQPDTALRLLPEVGGLARNNGFARKDLGTVRRLVEWTHAILMEKWNAYFQE